LASTQKRYITVYSSLSNLSKSQIIALSLPGLLAPLSIPDLAWTFISMDFIEDLPKSGTKNVILVVVDRLTKYAHFIDLSHPFTAQSVTQVLLDNIFKLHGPLVVIVTNRDKIFTSKLW
jgi:hypothetical protein